MQNQSLMEVLGHLLPDVPAALRGETQAVIIAVFLAVIFAFATWQLVQLVKFTRQANQVGHQLGEFTRLLRRDDLPGSRVDARRSASQSKGGKPTQAQAAHLWLEFDETLVDDGSSVTNTVPAAEFFGPDQIGHDLISNRLLSATPAILTALGLLGTFIGLSVGIGGLNLSPSADVEDLRLGIETMVAGAALGFTTSVWGVLMSLVVNVAHRMTASRFSEKARTLTRIIDGIFTQRSPEQSMVHIEAHTKESAESLTELHEKIGAQLQEAVAGISADMQSAVAKAIETSMTPSLEKLAEQTANQSAEVFDALIGKFSDGLRHLGESQAEQLAAASSSLQGRVDQLSEETARQAQANSAQAERFREQLTSVTELAESLASTLQGSITAISSHLDSSAASIEAASGNLSSSAQQLAEIAQSFTSTGDRLTAALDASVSVHEKLEQAQAQATKSLQSYSERLASISEAALEIASEITASATSATETFETLRGTQTQFLAEMRSRVDELTAQMRSWLQEYSEQVTHQTSERMNEWNNQTREFSAHMTDSMSQFARLVDDIETLLRKRVA